MEKKKVKINKDSTEYDKSTIICNAGTAQCEQWNYQTWEKKLKYYKIWEKYSQIWY